MERVMTHNQHFSTPQDALAHYGKIGMRWGIRNSGRPAGEKKINVKKAERHERDADRAQKAIDDILAKPATKWSFVQNSRDNQVAQLTEIRNVQSKAAEAVREGRMTDGQRKAVIGLAVAGGLLAAYGTYKYVDSGQFTQHKTKAIEWKQNKSLSKKFKNEDDIFNEVVKPINPGFGAIGTKMNCRRCTFAYELRRRGYDVRANRSSGATGQNAAGVHNAITPGAKIKTGRFGLIYNMMKEDSGGPTSQIIAKTWGEKTVDGVTGFGTETAYDRATAIFSALGTHPNGARGELGVGWTFGGGHSMAWEIVNNRPVIFDAQVGKTFSTPATFERFAENVTAAGHTRLDNVELNHEYLKRWAQNVD